MAPLTRKRAFANHVHNTDLAKEYYSQRASEPGTLIITEGTLISPRYGFHSNVPGIWNDEQVDAWKPIVDAVHAKGSFIFCHLWTVGRPSYVDVEHGLERVSASAIPLKGQEDQPVRALTKSEIEDLIKAYAQGARNAVTEAGFDGVVIHHDNGYLLDQFIQDVSNKRDDEYGGSIENRTRLTKEVLKRVIDVVGEERVAIRFSPWSTFQDMRMSDPLPTFEHIVQHISDSYPKFAWLEMIEPCVAGDSANKNQGPNDSNDSFRKIWGDTRPYITTGGYSDDVEAAFAAAESGPKTLVGFGRAFVPNPDVPARLRESIPFAPYDRSTFYVRGSTSREGYSAFPFASEARAALSASMSPKISPSSQDRTGMVHQ